MIDWLSFLLLNNWAASIDRTYFEILYWNMYAITPGFDIWSDMIFLRYGQLQNAKGTEWNDATRCIYST